jgi:two-component system NarL family response regulator
VTAPGKAKHRADRIRVLLVDDHPVLRRGLADIIAEEPDMEVAAAAGNAADAIALFRSERPDVTVFDLALPDRYGIELLSALRAEDADACLLVLSVHAGGEDVFRALEGGARGFVTKDARAEEVVAAIRQVHGGRRYLSPLAAERLAERLTTRGLAPREIEILRLIAAGRENKEIAAALGISEGTVKTHVHRLMEKLGASRRGEAVLRALRRGLLPEERG